MAGILDGVTLEQVLRIVAIDLVLSGDNAVVIAMAVKSLPSDIARRAAIIGAAGAVGLRILFTAMAAFLLNVPLLGAIGGLILFWIAYKLLIEEEEGEEGPGEINNFWEAVRIIILADLVMSLDNILAVGGAAHGSLVLLLFGLAVSIPIVLFGSQVLSTALKRFPWLAYVGSGILAYTAAEMITHDPKVKALMEAQMGTPHLGTTQYAMQLGAAALTLLLGYLASRRMAAKSLARHAAEGQAEGAPSPAERPNEA